MSIESVDIYVVDNALPANPLSGVVVKVLSADGKQVYAQLTTDVDGHVALLLETGTYQVRFFKFAVSFAKALLMEVVAPPTTNTFRVKGEPYVYPSSTDQRICYASGFFRTPSGGIARSVDIHFIAKWNPILLEGSPIMPERVTARTDENGFVSVPLIRFGQYDVTIQGMADYQRQVSVPDAASVPIGDLIFPTVLAVTFDEAPPYQVFEGDPLVLHPHVFSSDLNELPDITVDVLWSTSDGQNLSIVPAKDSITLVGALPGIYTLNAVRKDTSIVRIPNTPIQGVPVQIQIL